jgi:hypothetical protein
MHLLSSVLYAEDCSIHLTLGLDSEFVKQCILDVAEAICPENRVIGTLAMMRRDWRLRTVASTGLLFIPGWFAMWTMDDDIDWGQLPTCLPERSGSPQYCPVVLSAETSLFAAPCTGWFSVKRDISGSHQYCLVSCHMRHHWSEWEVGKGNENLVYPSPWDFKSSFTCHKILWHGTPGFSSHLKGRCTTDFHHPYKNSSPWPGSNPQSLGPVASTLTTTPPRRWKQGVISKNNHASCRTKKNSDLVTQLNEARRQFRHLCISP